jgi:hypothetical protein
MVVCQTAFAVQWTGMTTISDVSAARGARAHIERYNPDVTAESSSAWAAVCNQYDSSYGYAQVGYLEYESWGDHPYYFYEYSDNGGNDPGPQKIGLVPNGGNYDGSDDLFTVQYVAGGHIEYRINGVVEHTSGHNWTPDTCEWSGEIHEIITYPQMPGDPTHKVDFTSPALYSNNDDSWHVVSPDTDHAYDDALFGVEVLHPNATPKYFQIYDSRY